ncbi:MAG: hypothetical protein HN368_05460 [Spirochaetales bacterium]|jgi:hypothetical protein|nr:hypothetical protein [Spirochaetales bacterium]
MSEVDRYGSLSRKIKKRHSELGSSQVLQELRDAFISCMPNIPEDLKYDAAGYFTGVYAPTGTRDEIESAVRILLEFVYLVEEEFEKVEESFSVSDWEYLRDIFSDFALDLDQGTLMYVLQQVVSRGLMGD